MASTIIFSFAFVFVSTQLLITQAHFVIPKDHYEECLKEVGFDGDVGKLRYEDSDYPYKAKCIWDCGLKKHELVKDDGSLDRDATIALVKKIAKPGDQEKLSERVDDCIKTVKVVPDKCETAFDYIKCIYEK